MVVEGDGACERAVFENLLSPVFSALRCLMKRRMTRVVHFSGNAALLQMRVSPRWLILLPGLVSRLRGMCACVGVYFSSDSSSK